MACFSRMPVDPDYPEAEPCDYCRGFHVFRAVQ